MSGLIFSLAVSLALTLAFETAFFLITGKRNKKDFLLVVLVNALTNPVVVLAYWLTLFHTDWNRTVVTVALELWVVLTEAHCYKKYGHEFSRPFLFSAAANAVAFGMGRLLQYLI